MKYVNSKPHLFFEIHTIARITFSNNTDNINPFM
jgi:hypothetical protein